MTSKIEAEIERVVQSVNEWDDRTSPDDYPDHLLITSEELADILRNFAGATTTAPQDHLVDSSLARIGQALKAEAQKLREDYEAAYAVPCNCATPDSALHYGRAQGMEMAADIIGNSILKEIPNV
ncbi:hypothetical protein EPK99_06325 [Neorhizobium lilium]|uniref:Uncharacterized protein n=1 Tax=Neorhizobium lilium TaxID=2503024 RepID=A0A3S3VNC4_9HYPH|nr:hypothetical protein [Neorhizobium lilium]RWX78248.1 hypothetical protein EPK99_06325 [Neorhizobium lilium]